MSSMESDYLDGTDMGGEKVGLCGYGSGAKAKVFEGRSKKNGRRSPLALNYLRDYPRGLQLTRQFTSRFIEVPGKNP